MLNAVQAQVGAGRDGGHQETSRVQFDSGIGGVQEDIAALRTKMRKENQRKELPKVLPSIQNIRSTPGLSGRVEDTMKSVYQNPTLAPAPTGDYVAAIRTSLASEGQTGCVPTTVLLQEQQKSFGTIKTSCKLSNRSF